MVTTTIKRLLRPLIPDRLMARYRLEQHSRHSRVNVDVFVSDRGEANRWLRTTPDTYRVRLGVPDSRHPMELVQVFDQSAAVDASILERATIALASPGISAVIAAETKGPRLVDRRRAEPTIGPRLVVTREEVLDEIGGVPAGEHPLPGLVARLRDAGHHLGLIPLTLGDSPVVRTDPIDSLAIVVLAAVPMHDIGGGSRSAQLALELVKRGFHVAYVSMYEAQESVDLGLRFIHPNLEQYKVTHFDPHTHHARVGKGGRVLVEAPAASLAAPAFALQAYGWDLIYDVIDDWSDPGLGGDWYEARIEESLIHGADRLVASAPDLVERVAGHGGSATLVPNAVNAAIFGVDRPPRPHDLPEAELILGYHGSLYGDWFDWDSLMAVANEFPQAAVVVIGDDKAPHPEMPPNVHFLGLKSQVDLPGYLQRFEVGLLPFRVNKMTHAVSPLKVYEYLASGVSVAAPPLRALDGIEAVHTADRLEEAVKAAASASPPDRRAALHDHSWERRLELLIGRQPPGAQLEIKVVSRPAIHHPRRDRIVNSARAEAG